MILSRGTAIIGLILFTAACGNSPTGPTGGSTIGLTIDTVTPGNLQPSPTPQVLTITGTNFTAGVGLEVLTPDGQKFTAPGTAVSATSFQASVVLGTSGLYRLDVLSATGDFSPTYPIEVRLITATTPEVTAAEPALLQHSAQPASILLLGSNLDLTTTVTLIDPTGALVTITPGSLVATVTSVTFTATFNASGTYTVFVTTSTPEDSNAVLMTVQ